MKNCESIERGYDLDKLKCDYIQEKTSDWVKQAIDENAYELEQDAKCFIEGFQKALELMGDKKFSEGDMYEAIRKAKKYDVIPNHEGVIVNFNYSKEEITQSLQQTEWDVEVVTKKVINETKIIGAVKGVKGSGNKITTYKQIPKLDADGCLILKRL
jgi:hypothetical protein